MRHKYCGFAAGLVLSAALTPAAQAQDPAIAFDTALSEAAWRESRASQETGRALSGFLRLPLFFERTRLRDIQSALKELGLTQVAQSRIDNTRGHQDYEEWAGAIAHPVLGPVTITARLSGCTTGTGGFFSAKTVYSYSLSVAGLSPEKRADLSGQLSAQWQMVPNAGQAAQGLAIHNPQIYGSGKRQESHVARGHYLTGSVTFYSARSDGAVLRLGQTFQCD